MRGTLGPLALGAALCALVAVWPAGCGMTRCGSDADCAEGLVCHAPTELCVDPGTTAIGGEGAGGSTLLPAGGSSGGGSSPYPASCRDGERSGDETDVDCGGGTCPDCAQGQQCESLFDCDGLTCQNGYCCAATCSPCTVCDQPGHEGVCVPAPLGQDPRGDCLGAISCNGVDGCCSAVECSIGGHADLGAAGIAYGSALTVEAWIHWLGPTGAAQQRLLSHGEDSSGVAWQLAIVADATLAFAATTDAGPCLVEAIGVTPSRDHWQHVAAVLAAGALRLYVAGSLVAEGFCAPGSIQSPGGMAILVGHPSDSWANAIIDEVRLSGAARYDASFTPSTRLASDGDTLGLWHFDDGSGRVALDSSGHGRDGALETAMWSAQSVCDVAP